MKKLLLLTVIISSNLIAQSTFYVDDVSSNGNGTESSPFNDIAYGIEQLDPGDELMIMPGTYTVSESIFSGKSGTKSSPIKISGQDPDNKPIITRSGDFALFRIYDSHLIIDNIICDGAERGANVIVMKGNLQNISILNTEVRNSERDAIAIDGVRDILIDNCNIHHILRKENGRDFDAHGIVAYHQRNLTIRNTNISYVSGDCVQSDPSKEAPLWDTIIIENCNFWTGPLDKDYIEYSAGEVPGENAVDFKTATIDDTPNGYKPFVKITNVKAWGFVYGPPDYSDRAAFNIKHNVRAELINCMAHSSEIGFRLRGPYQYNGMNFDGSHVTMINCVAYNNDKAIWLERNIEDVKIFNCTFDKPSDGTFFDYDTEFQESGFEMKNCVFVNDYPTFFEDELPGFSLHSSNIVASESEFKDVSNNDYHLSVDSECINEGVDIEDVTFDFNNVPRTDALDVGAYEYNPNYVVSTIKPHLGDNEFNVYPNPAVNQINISDNDNIASFEIYNMAGQIVKNSTSQNGTIDISDISKGMYVIQFNTKDGMKVIRKFIKK